MGPEQRRPASSAVDAAIEEVAADWLARRQEGMTAEDHARFQQWLRADAQHAEAFTRLERTWEMLLEPRRFGRADEVERGLRRAAGRRRRVLTAGGLGLAASLMLGLLVYDRGAIPPAAPAATIAWRPLRQVLPDGSVAEFNAGAEIQLAYTPARREVRLVRGEVLFQVTKNTERPFVVVAGSLEVKAVGTAFSVRHTAGEVGVLVTEGKVTVERPVPAGPEAIYLVAGDQVTVAPGDVTAALPQPERITPEAAGRALAWRGMRVEFTGTSLVDAVAILNQRNALQLQVADPALERFQLTGVYWADDPEGFVRLLEKGMDVRAVRVGEVIQLKKP